MVRSRQSAISVVWCQAFEEQYLKSSKRGCLQKTLHPYIGFVIDITALVFVANRQAGAPDAPNKTTKYATRVLLIS
jgi:hypothetical protein